MKNIINSVIFFAVLIFSFPSYADKAPVRSNKVSKIVDLNLENAFPELTFEQPIEMLVSPDTSNKIYIAEKSGKIKVFENSASSSSAKVFLDLSEIVKTSASETGLLGLAFHPKYKNNGYFFVHYSEKETGATKIVRYSVSAEDPDLADPQSAKNILSVSQPFANHNGGKIAFGPDGFLYISLGDGGSAGDPLKNAQNRKSLLGKILRINVNKKNRRYTIPTTNPFRANKNKFRPEIYAYGLRNVWKFSFDSKTKRLWAADVGQNKREEINIIKRGRNYGWNIMEASLCYPDTVNCNKKNLELPVYEYNHAPRERSITGGFVYRGRQIPSLVGKYVFADFVSGSIYALSYVKGKSKVKKIVDSGFLVSSFGLDRENELYVLDYLNGTVFRLVPA